MTDKAKLEEIKKLADAMYYAAFNLTTDASLLRKAMNEYHQFVIHKYCKEEPVSEDLEKAAIAYNKKVNFVVVGKIPNEHFIAGAKWQKQKDDREIKMVRELLADFDKHCDEYHEAGFKHGQEALLKEAVEAVCDVTIHEKGDEVQYSVLYPVGKRPFHKGDKVKVIVIKED